LRSLIIVRRNRAPGSLGDYPEVHVPRHAHLPLQLGVAREAPGSALLNATPRGCLFHVKQPTQAGGTCTCALPRFHVKQSSDKMMALSSVPFATSFSGNPESLDFHEFRPAF
jgi:hypothetical protein